MAEQQTLPERLTLAEDGEWEMPYTGVSTMNIDHDAAEWTSYGWKAVTYEGKRHFMHKDKAMVQQWLREQGYQDTGDGSHYQRMADVSIQAGDRLEFIGPKGIDHATFTGWTMGNNGELCLNGSIGPGLGVQVTPRSLTRITRPEQKESERKHEAY